MCVCVLNGVCMEAVPWLGLLESNVAGDPYREPSYPDHAKSGRIIIESMPQERRSNILYSVKKK